MSLLRKLYNLFFNSKWTACEHPLELRSNKRGYHTHCDPKKGGCGVEWGR